MYVYPAGLFCSDRLGCEAAATLEDSSVSIHDFAVYVTGYISTCVDNTVPNIQVEKFTSPGLTVRHVT